MNNFHRLGITLALALIATPAAADQLVLEPAAARWVPVAVRVPPQAAAEAGAGSHVMHFVVQRLAAGAVVNSAAGNTPAAPRAAEQTAPRAAEQTATEAVREKSTFMVPR